MAKRPNSALEIEIGRYWDERAESYSNFVRGELDDGRCDAWRRVLNRVSCGCIADMQLKDRVPRVLDLGCGPGFFSILFAEMGCMVDAVDASGEMLARAYGNVLAEGLDDRVMFCKSDVATLPYMDGSFDLVVSRNLMWLMREPEAAYAEWMRVLRPGGKLVLFDANWYLYLFDEAVNAQRHADQDGKSIEEWADDARATTAEERRCERFARELPLSPIVRPAWDLDVLERLGAVHVRVDEEAWAELWTASEYAFYASSPLFMVEAVKEAA